MELTATGFRLQPVGCGSHRRGCRSMRKPCFQKIPISGGVGDTMYFVQRKLEKKEKAGRSRREVTREEGPSRKQKV